MQDNFRPEFLNLDQYTRRQRMRGYWRQLGIGTRIRLYRRCGYGWIRAVVYAVI